MLGRTKQSWCVCRSLGVHCSKVRSLTLDSWEPELLKVRAKANGNEAVKLMLVKL